MLKQIFLFELKQYFTFNLGIIKHFDTYKAKTGSKKIVSRAILLRNIMLLCLYHSLHVRESDHLRSPLLPDDAGDEGGDEEDEENGGEDHDDADGGALVDV